MRVSLLLILTLALPSMAQNLSLSFDDGLNPQKQPQAPQWNEQILAHLAQTKTKAIFFVTGNNVNSPKGLELVKDWGEQGHALANHTYSHRSLHSSKVTLQEYLQDMEKNHQLLSGYPGWVNRFRFPYLKEGKDKLKRDGVRTWLKEHQYKSGAVSIDASDWYYNQHYLKLLRKGDDDKVALLKQAYLEHLWGRAQYYDGLSQQMLNRSVDHVLLLHVNAINAAFLSEVIAMFRAKGWHFIAPLKAFEDPIYHQAIDVLPAGESILWQVAKAKDIKGLRYPAEDSRYEREKIDKILAR